MRLCNIPRKTQGCRFRSERFGRSGRRILEELGLILGLVRLWRRLGLPLFFGLGSSRFRVDTESRAPLLFTLLCELLGSGGDGDEPTGVERCAANERAVDVVLSEEPLRVVGFD